MKKSKKGQIFIIAAIIIIVVLISLAGISNKSYFTKTPEKFYDLSNNLQLEGYNLYDYGKYNKKDAKEIINNFTEIFSNYIQATGENTEFMVIQGNNKNVTWTTYESTGGVSTAWSSNPIETQSGSLTSITKSEVPTGNKIALDFGNNTYNFELTNEDTVIFVLTKSEGFNSWVQSTYNENAE